MRASRMLGFAGLLAAVVWISAATAWTVPHVVGGGKIAGDLLVWLILGALPAAVLLWAGSASLR